MITVSQTRRHYADENNHFHQKKILNDTILITIDVEILSDNFIQFQKEIFQESFAELEENLTALTKKDEKNIKNVFEDILQSLNSKLTVFGDKMTDTDFFAIKGGIKIYADTILFASLIGNTSALIFRDQGLYYSVNNEYSQYGKIDLFSEFIEGEIENGDKILFVGNDIHVVFDQKEIKKFNDIFAQGGLDTIDFLEETMTMRLDQSELTFISQDSIEGVATGTVSTNKKRGYTLPGKRNFSTLLEKASQHKYRIIVGTLGLLTLFLLSSAIKTMGGSTKPTYVDLAGNEKIISPEQIKKDITYFQKLDASSNEKNHLYRDIITQLDRLESEGYRPEDIENWRRILQQHYNKGFNIIFETDLNNFDDELSNTKAQLFAFSDTEKETLGTPLSLTMTHQLLIGGTNGGMIGPVNEDIRGTLVASDDETGDFMGCSSNILRDGMYCYNEVGNITNLTKAGTINVTTESAGGFPSSIGGLDIFGKTNLYTLTTDSFDNQDGIYITRYRNIVGTQNQFQIGDNYLLPLGSGNNAPDVTAFGIDGNFLVWNDSEKAIQQRWREGTTFTLNSRTIEVIGGAKDLETTSSNVKLLSTINTRYTILFDQDNQSITVYDSVGLKTNDAYTTNYSLKYLMKFAFELNEEYIVDIAITDADGNQLRLYVLTDKGVYKIKLYDFIEQIQSKNE